MNTGESRCRPQVVVVGGFLGAGKTSLILAAADTLSKRGIRSAVILNDQSQQLVDTRNASERGIISGEVTGGCFCCRFSELIAAMDRVRAHAPDVIFAEPVGSCTDISGTVLGPLSEEFGLYRVAPFTVLVDPARAEALQSAGADPHLAFLFQKQLEEADLVCLTKADLYPNARIPGISGRYLSAKTGQGVREWLEETLSGGVETERRTLDIDYDRYARAEAALVWLNLSLTLEPDIPQRPATVVGPIMDRLDEALTAAGIVIVHLKIFDRAASGWLKAAICANGQEPNVEGTLDASPAGRHELLVNLRAVGDSIRVQEVAENQLEILVGNVLEVRLDCFHPSAPRPERGPKTPRPHLV